MMQRMMPRLTHHAAHGVNHMLKKSMHGIARYTSDITVSQCRLRPYLAGAFCVFSII